MTGGKQSFQHRAGCAGRRKILLPLALFGRIPAIAPSPSVPAANIKNGGRTPVAGMVPCGRPSSDSRDPDAYASWIPDADDRGDPVHGSLPTCASGRAFARLAKTAPKSDIAVLALILLNRCL